MPSLVNLKRHPKTKYLQFHEPIPPELWEEAGKRTHTVSLKVRTIAQALPLWEHEKAKFDAMLAMWRGAPTQLTPREIEALVGQWYARAEQSLSDNPHDLKRWTDIFGFLDAAHRTLKINPKWGQATKAVRLAASELIESNRLVLSAGTRAALEAAIFRRLPDLNATLERRVIKRDYGPDETLRHFPKWEPKVQSREPATPSSGITFELMLQRWEATSGTTNTDTIKFVHMVIGEFKVFVKHADPASVTTDDVLRWRDMLLLAKSPATVNRKWLMALNTVYAATATGVGADRLKQNPVEGTQTKDKSSRPKKRRVPYSVEAVAAILKASRAFEDVPERRWFPWVLAYTGFRYREAAQLLAADVQKKNGVWCIDANEDQPFKRLKKKPGDEVSPSLRDFPVHPALIAEDFAVYAQSLAPTDFLFPKLAPHADGRDNDGASSKWREWINGIAGGEGIAPAHSFRHLMEDLLREATEDTELRLALMGRAIPGTAPDYGRGHGMSRKAEVIARIPAFLLER